MKKVNKNKYSVDSNMLLIVKIKLCRPQGAWVGNNIPEGVFQLN